MSLRQKLGKSLIQGQSTVAARAHPSAGAVVNYT